ncbi:hypothetical protein CONLIGDRAFT_677931 [Coniochaeta ligniaria NRRL 30616]|uniref:Uncharacterized protein n=1 Tax=Coniochaeta ligniaria NRRL 30616 TaxID=1408157 RepID=A0A1J7J4D1_9PEZI|nr:hypothetical protein CONLIGDRAFT_677931 [Coniochaeta ligniaria NRRL 30616]
MNYGTPYLSPSPPTGSQAPLSQACLLPINEDRQAGGDHRILLGYWKHPSEEEWSVEERRQEFLVTSSGSSARHSTILAVALSWNFQKLNRAEALIEKRTPTEYGVVASQLFNKIQSSQHPVASADNFPPTIRRWNHSDDLKRLQVLALHTLPLQVFTTWLLDHGRRELPRQKAATSTASCLPSPGIGTQAAVSSRRRRPDMYAISTQHNWGAKYKFAVDVQSKGFEEAPDTILQAVQQLKWAGTSAWTLVTIDQEKELSLLVPETFWDRAPVPRTIIRERKLTFNDMGNDHRPAGTMGGALWTAPEEDYFWTQVVTNSDKRLGC